LSPILKELPSKSVHIPFIQPNYASQNNRYGIPIDLGDLPEHISVP